MATTAVRYSYATFRGGAPSEVHHAALTLPTTASPAPVVVNFHGESMHALYTMHVVLTEHRACR